MAPNRRSSLSQFGIFLSGIAITLFSQWLEIPLIFGITLSFTNILLLLMIRYHGIVLGSLAAVICYTVPLLYWDAPHHEMVFLLEVVCIGCWITWSKKGHAMIGSVLYWLVIGIPLLTAAYLYTYGSSISNEFWLMIGIYVANSLFNVTCSDMIWRYMPAMVNLPATKEKFAAIREPLHFSKVLLHTILIAITLPFVFYMLTNSRNTYESLLQSSYQLASNAAHHIDKDLLNWDRRVASRPTDESLTIRNGLRELKSEYTSDLYQVVLVDYQGMVIFDSASKATRITEFIPTAKDNIIRDNYFLRLSPNQSKLLPNLKWHDASFIYSSQTSAYAIPLRLYVIVPMQPYQEKVINEFAEQFAYLVAFMLGAALISRLLNMRLVHGLSKLASVSTDLSSRLQEVPEKDWPVSRIFEIKTLVNNFRSLSIQLLRLLKESENNYRLLQAQTLQLQESEKQLHELAYYDELTGLPNRIHFHEFTRSLNLDQPDCARPFAAMFADINRFKQFNDTLGHTFGDTLLRSVADRFKDTISEECKVFRISGDEFLFILHYDDISDVQETARQICLLINEPFEIEGRTLYTSLSLGISVFPYDGSDMGSILRNADIAMYVAKEQGGGHYHFYDKLMEEERQENMRLENDLRNALHEDQFVLHYQPKVHAVSKKVIGAEALIRWNHPELGFVSPAQFIPLAENTGIILEIDEWVLREACRQNKTWQDAGLPKFPIAVNLSAKHFYQSDLIPMIKRVLEDTQIEPQYIVLEITEGTFIKDVDFGVQIMRDLREMGIHLSIDDFGTGYSSLSQLERLPISEMKLDRSFIQGLVDDSRKSSIVKTVIELGHHMKLKVVAEGVESPQELQYLTDLDCDEFQGYYFSKPLPSKEFTSFVQDWNGAVLPG